ncbi:hypothetical protein B1M_02555 [Burkholderia sp. TJI49]|nr:hypothetical protein B1M_02555 [Burkholderia sp. TJI49]
MNGDAHRELAMPKRLFRRCRKAGRYFAVQIIRINKEMS